MKEKIYYIGIGGATRSGKSTLSRNIAKLLNADERKLIHLDRYFNRQLVAKYNRNWEIPEILNWDKMINDIKDKKRIIKYQNYSFIISEGYLLFKEPLCHNFDKSIFIWITKKECKKRRMATKPKSEDYFENKIWASYIKYNYHLAKYKRNKDIRYGGDILVLDSTKETKEEMAEKSLKFILGDKDLIRDLKKEQELLNAIEIQYNKMMGKGKTNYNKDNKKIMIILLIIIIAIINFCCIYFFIYSY